MGLQLQACLLALLVLVACSKKDSEGHVATVFLAGGQKCGSSSLFELLIKHPKLLKGFHKEPHFWNSADFDRGLDFYSKNYPSEKFTGGRDGRFIDGTPMMEFAYSWQRMRETYDAATRRKLRFIVVLREPVSRDFSWYMHNMRLGLFLGTKLKRVETMKEIEEAHAGRGRGGQYLEQLRWLMNVFPRRQVFVVNLASLISNTRDTVERIRRFLNVSHDAAFEQPFPHDDHLKAFRKKGGEHSESVLRCILRHVPPLDCSLRDSYGEYYQEMNTQLYAYLNNATRLQADPNEPEFPSFQDYHSIPCVEDARKAYDALLASDSDSDTRNGGSGAGSHDNTSDAQDADDGQGKARRRAQHVHLKDRLEDGDEDWDKTGTCHEGEGEDRRGRRERKDR